MWFSETGYTQESVLVLQSFSGDIGPYSEREGKKNLSLVIAFLGTVCGHAALRRYL